MPRDSNQNDKQQQREYSKSPDYAGQGIIKSQKNISSTSTFHMKTENDRGDEQQHRSPDIGRSDLRETWRRPRMPYNRLPEVFNQQKQKIKYVGKTRQDTLKDLDKLVQNNEYKEAQKHLKPLQFKEDEKRKQSKENGNPVIPVKKMMRMAAKIEEEIKQIQDLSMDRFKNLKNGPRINECIILQIIKRGHTTGTIKKMLHVPTLTLICIREQPMTTKQSRNIMRDWIQFWREKLNSQPNLFVNVYETLYGYPEGAISILMSLLNLLDLTTTLPESVIREVFTQLLKCLQSFYNLTNMHFGGLSPSQIMITDEGKVKLSLGLFYRIPNLQVYGIYNIRGFQKPNALQFNSTFSKLMKTSIEKPLNLDVERSVDVFKLGLIMLNCAIGSFQNFEQSGYIFETMKHIFTDQGQKQVDKENVCCLIHSQQYLLELNQSYSLEAERVKTTDRFISYIKLIKDRFSIHFTSFLCSCLKLSHQKRATLADLMNSPFIISAHDNENKTVKIDLNDLLAIGRGWGQQIFESGTHHKMGNFLGHLRQVLEQCSRQNLTELLQVHRDRIYSIGKQIGLNSQVLGKKLEENISQILRANR